MRNRCLVVDFSGISQGQTEPVTNHPAYSSYLYRGLYCLYKGIIITHDTDSYELKGFWTLLTWFSRWGKLGDILGTWRKIVHEMVTWISSTTSELEGYFFWVQVNAMFVAFLPHCLPRCLKKIRKKTNLTWNVRRMQWKMKEKRLKLDHFKQAEPIPHLMSPDLRPTPKQVTPGLMKLMKLKSDKCGRIWCFFDKMMCSWNDPLAGL